MDQLTGKIENWLADHRAELLEDLQTLMSFESLDENTAARQAALRFVLSRAREMGMRTGHTAEYDAGWAEIGSGSVTLGILAHVDVVAVGDRANWATPPFALTERDGWYCGRGIEDDKGPVIMSPVTGTVAEVNEELLDAPQKLNESPYGAWIARIENVTETEELLDAAAYEALTRNAKN